MFYHHKQRNIYFLLAICLFTFLQTKGDQSSRASDCCVMWMASACCQCLVCYNERVDTVCIHGHTCFNISVNLSIIHVYHDPAFSKVFVTSPSLWLSGRSPVLGMYQIKSKIVSSTQSARLYVPHSLSLDWFLVRDLLAPDLPFPLSKLSYS